METIVFLLVIIPLYAGVVRVLEWFELAKKGELEAHLQKEAERKKKKGSKNENSSEPRMV